ncbi:MAG: spore coat associated protein CotJA [Eubacteriales bacterium]
MMDYPKKCIEECGKPMPDLSVGEAFIKYQPYVGIIPLKEGFERGSVWPDLYKPYKHPMKYMKK